jgi:hypothetical protein
VLIVFVDQSQDCRLIGDFVGLHLLSRISRPARNAAGQPGGWRFLVAKVGVLGLLQGLGFLPVVIALHDN